MTTTNVIVIGAGQAGLCVSYYLAQHAIDHVVLEARSIGESWRTRWDSFTLVTPNRLNRLPNFPSGGEPDGFLSRAEVIEYLEGFAATFSPPVRCGVRVTAVLPQPDGTFVVETDAGAFTCRNVVVATNIFHTPRVPKIASGFPRDVVHLHSGQYKNAAQIRSDGAVLVVGSGQSGTQICDELRHAGFRTYLSVSRAGRLPRRFRGRDMMDWIRIFKGWEQTVDQLDSPEQRTAARPHVTGQHGGKTFNLRRFGREGVGLVGKLAGVRDGRISFADDLEDNLRKADDFATELCAAINAAIEKTGVEALPPDEDDLVPEAWRPPHIVRELHIEEARIRSVVWATGYPIDFSWVKGVEVDPSGYPIHKRGVTARPGIYFASLPWLYKHKSSSLYGAGEDAEYVAAHIAQRQR
jgi:putative flavoprotein involved in K+ transport